MDEYISFEFQGVSRDRVGVLVEEYMIRTIQPIQTPNDGSDWIFESTLSNGAKFQLSFIFNKPKFVKPNKSSSFSSLLAVAHH